MSGTKERRVHTMFVITMALKAAHATIEIVGGLLLFFFSNAQLTQAVDKVTGPALAQNPQNILANLALKLMDSFSAQAQQFSSYYLFVHGLVNMTLVILLVKGKLWAYPASLIIYSGFVCYQLYRYTNTHSIGLLFLSLFDLIVIWSVWSEYKEVQKHPNLK